jgi:hypothetical protein
MPIISLSTGTLTGENSGLDLSHRGPFKKSFLKRLGERLVAMAEDEEALD